MREINLGKKDKNRTQSAVHKRRPNIQWFPLHECVCLADINLPVAFQNKRSAVVHKKQKKLDKFDLGSRDLNINLLKFAVWDGFAVYQKN